MKQLPIWPKILLVMKVKNQPMTPAEIAEELGICPRQVYASMSSLGLMASRWWIEPVEYWSRTGKFNITPKGTQTSLNQTRAA